MPRYDGTGPMCQGSMTGRGAGLCNQRQTLGNNDLLQQTGFGPRSRGFNRSRRNGAGRCSSWQRGNYNQAYTDDSRTFLEQTKTMLQEQLNIIQEKLNSFSQDSKKDVDK